MRTRDYKWITRYANKDEAYRRLSRYWQASEKAEAGRHANVIGAGESLQIFLLAALLAESLEKNEEAELPFIIVPDELRLRRLRTLLDAFWPGEYMLFPAREYQLSSVEAASREQMHQRLACLSALVQGRRPIIISSPVPFMQPLPPQERFEESLIRLKIGGRLEPQDLAARLSQIGYESVKLTETAGEFSSRGDIVDIVPIDRPVPEEIPEEEQAALYGIRVSFFDDEIDQIRYFDVATQRQVAPVSPVVIPPAREVLLKGEEALELAEKILAWSEEEARRMYRNGAGKEEVRKMRQFCRYDAERIQSGTERGLIDRWLGLLYEEKTSLADYLKAFHYRPVISETLAVSRRMDAREADRHQQISHLTERGKGHRLMTEAFFKASEVMTKLDKEFNVLSFALIQQLGNGFPGAERFDIRGREAESYRGRDDQLFADLEERRDTGAATYVFIRDQKRQDRFNTELLQRAPGACDGLIPRALGRGFEWPEASLLVLGEEDIFGSERKKRRRRRKRSGGTPIEFFSDLSPGDLVVHEAHGIGVYVGLQKLESDGAKRDYIKIRYAGDDILYLPMDALDQISKYVGSGGRKPRLSKLDGAEWNRLKERARDSIRQLATNLVELYAKRSKLKGHAFPPDTSWDREFSASFPYEETEDQLRCIREVKEDMESEKVMDRLLCGDVGFGKTEVAFRAMFKAVNGGMQAALLAPTTVLARQHYQTFKERLGDFPVRVGHLSRVASDAMQKRTIKGLADGEIDVVIGTHRMLSKDVKFKRLGLLVVDEEQRFGVDHKERMKELYPRVDVLTLSATPIPRTLHMSMSGIRDISVIEEAPSDRREVQTYVMEYDEEVIADAILREVSRGGQVFYLFNNTHKIIERARRLEKRLPGLRVAVAHGQMPEGQLEDVINDFVDGASDVLVCTTIIESGIDMPNVNTLVVTHAERFGLSQIYQLKGRVGRSGRQAYAYITYEKNTVIKEQAQKRLAAIREFTELGSGFRIALRDLEVRGAGNLLGAEQHGHMEAIGYDLYVQMLDAEVKRILQEKQEENAEIENLEAPVSESVQRVSRADEAAALGTRYLPPDPVDTQVDIPLDAYLPADLIEDEGQRMDMYRRLGDIETLEDYYDIIDELTDRYGDIPPEAFTLADISYVRARAGIIGIRQIRCEKKNVVLQFKEGERPNMEALSILLSLPEYKGKIHFNAGVKAHLLWVNAAEPVKMLPERLRRLFAAAETAKESPAAEKDAEDEKEEGTKKNA